MIVIGNAKRGDKMMLTIMIDEIMVMMLPLWCYVQQMMTHDE